MQKCTKSTGVCRQITKLTLRWPRGWRETHVWMPRGDGAYMNVGSISDPLPLHLHHHHPDILSDLLLLADVKVLIKDGRL